MSGFSLLVTKTTLQVILKPIISACRKPKEGETPDQCQVGNLNALEHFLQTVIHGFFALYGLSVCLGKDWFPSYLGGPENSILNSTVKNYPMSETILETNTFMLVALGQPI